MGWYEALVDGMVLGVGRWDGTRRWSMGWYEALVQRWQGAVVVVAWVAPGGVLAFVAARGAVAVVVALLRGRRRRRRGEGPRSRARFPPACANLTGIIGQPHIQGGSEN